MFHVKHPLSHADSFAEFGPLAASVNNRIGAPFGNTSTGRNRARSQV